jgi:hypothetical protein
MVEDMVGDEKRPGKEDHRFILLSNRLPAVKSLVGINTKRMALL